MIGGGDLLSEEFETGSLRIAYSRPFGPTSIHCDGEERFRWVRNGDRDQVEAKCPAQHVHLLEKRSFSVSLRSLLF